MDEARQFALFNLIMGIALGIAIAGLFISIRGNPRMVELGKSICEEEYGMDYESYINEVLRCKPFKESYDGIQVEVPKGTNEKLRG